MDSLNGTDSGLIVTGDGSHTLLHSTLKQHYHSLQGSLAESEHIFMSLGLKPKLEADGDVPVSIFEMGFGTGLNALLSWKLADETGKVVAYTGIEAYPVQAEQRSRLNYEALTGKRGLELLHETAWGEGFAALSDFFLFRKAVVFLEDYQPDGLFDVIYFDAFSPESQPELWSVEVFRKMASILKVGGYLVTYSSKGAIRRAMAEAGFEVEKHPGPGRKREVVRAIKTGIEGS